MRYKVYLCMDNYLRFISKTVKYKKGRIGKEYENITSA